MLHEFLVLTRLHHLLVRLIDVVEAHLLLLPEVVEHRADLLALDRVGDDVDVAEEAGLEQDVHLVAEEDDLTVILLLREELLSQLAVVIKLIDGLADVQVLVDEPLASLVDGEVVNQVFHVELFVQGLKCIFISG